MRDPPQVELIAAYIDWSRGSNVAWWIGAGAPYGPSVVHFFRSALRIVKRPFFVPTRSATDFAIAFLLNLLTVSAGQRGNDVHDIAVAEGGVFPAQKARILVV